MLFSNSWISGSPPAILLWALIFSGVAIAGQYPLPILHKDVVILGGGASGTYAAVRLREDYGKSVLLVERESILVITLV
jgi:hypothetical protein